MKQTPRSIPTATEKQAASLSQSLLALSELPLRLSCLSRHLESSSLKALAPSLNLLAQNAQSTDPRAREVLVTVAIFLAQRRESPLIEGLREEARQSSLLSLERLVREGGDEEIPKIEADARIPDYGTGRELTVGERRSLARRPSRLQIERLLLDPHPLVLEPLFQCPALTEDDVLLVAARRPARVLALELIGNSPRWMARRRVRLSLILNPATPHGLALPLVSTCRRDDLAVLVSASNLRKTLRAVAHELHSRLPPLRSQPPSVHH